jgi:hypothetical protein
VLALVEARTGLLVQQVRQVEVRAWVWLHLHMSYGFCSQEELNSTRSRLADVQEQLALEVAKPTHTSAEAGTLSPEGIKELMNTIFISVSEAVEGLNSDGEALTSAKVMKAFKVVLRDVTKQTLTQIASR